MSVKKSHPSYFLFILTALSLRAGIPDSFLSARGIDAASSSVLVVDPRYGRHSGVAQRRQSLLCPLRSLNASPPRA